MRVVIDTNALLVSISSKSKYHPIYQAVLNGSIELCFSNSILEEYEEILSINILNADELLALVSEL